MADIVDRLRQDISPSMKEAVCPTYLLLEAAAEIERLREVIRGTMCPSGGYTGQPDNEEPTVDACLKAGVCGCDLGAAIHIHKRGEP